MNAVVIFTEQGFCLTRHGFNTTMIIVNANDLHLQLHNKGDNVMKIRSLMIVLAICIPVIFSGCWSKTGVSDTTVGKPTVVVSIVPQETFVKAVAGDLVDIVTMVPPGSSPENYAPTPQELQAFSEASIYFSIGVPTELANILPKAYDINKNLKVVKLADEVGAVHPARYFAPGEADPHIWLSPKRVKVMIDVISKELSALDPENRTIYEMNAQEYKERLDKLDENIKTSLSGIQNRTFIVYHPAFGYFADDYGLEMLSLEEEGKEATAKEIQDKIDRAKSEGIKVIFYQAEMDSRQARTFAGEIGGKAEQVAPLAADYIENLEKIAQTFASLLK